MITINNNFGLGMIEAIELAEYTIREHDGVFIASDVNGVKSNNIDLTVQAIVDSFNPIPYAKKGKRKELNDEGLRRIQLIFPAISDFDELDLVREQFLSTKATARNPTVKFQQLIDTVQARNQARTSINALTTVADINNYDVVNTPTWPV